MAAAIADRIGALTPGERIARLHELESAARSVEAEMGLLVAAIGSDGLFRDDGHLTIGGFLRSELRWSKEQVNRRVRLGRVAVDVPIIVEHLDAAAIGVDQAHLLARAAANPRCGEQLPEHAPLLLEHARVLDHAGFSRVVQRWTALADADGAHRDAEADHERRRAALSYHDGVGRLQAQCGALDHAQFAAIFERYRYAEFLTDREQAASRYGEDAADGMLARTDAQRSWDALLRMALDAASTPPGSQAPEPVVDVVCDIATLEAQFAAAGLTPGPERSAEPELPDLPVGLRRCETSTGLPVAPADAMQLAIHGRIRRVVIDTNGVVLDYGRLRRLFEGSLRDAVMLHSPTCIFPGCGRPASWCQADHITPWAFGGVTSIANGGPMCPKHNRIRNRGYVVWRDPTGVFHTYRPDGTEIAPAPPPPGTGPQGTLDAA